MKICALALSVAVLVLAGCGGKAGAGAPAGADVAPASAAAFVWFDTDLKSDQWRATKALLARFPGRAKLLAALNKELAKDNLDFDRDVKPALGDEVDIVWLDFANDGENAVGLAKPRNRAKFEKLLAASKDTPLVSAQLDGWTIFSDEQKLLDRFRAEAREKALADDEAFTDAFGRLDEDTISRAYVSGRALQRAYERSFEGSPVRPGDFGSFGPIIASAKAQQGGARVDADAEMHVQLKPDPTPDPYTAKLPRELPAGALLYVSYAQLDKELRATFNELEKVLPGFEQQRAQVEGAFGTSLEKDIYPLLSGEAAFAIYPGSPLPAFEFVLALKDEAKARRLVERLNGLLALSGEIQPKTARIGGVAVTEIPLPDEGYTLRYAVFDHKLVISNARVAFSSPRAGKKLADDPLYKAARDAAGTPSKSIGFVYANLRDGLPVAFEYARKDGEEITADTVANTRPLQSAILSFARDGDHFQGTGFVTIK
jgi:hypothetical protein